jgi:GNAT superfamily N-acetyltransferase
VAIEVVTTGDRPGPDAGAVIEDGFPEFIFHDQHTARFLERVRRYFPMFDVLVLDDGVVVAGGWGVPIAWSGEKLPGGYDDALAASVLGHENGTVPDTLCVMAAAVRAGQRGSGLARTVLPALRDRASAAGLSKVLAPVRPTMKSRYPLTPMNRFATWSRADGLHVDPWIRTHQRLGASILWPAPRSMEITGTVAEWEEWTGMLFPESGQYVIPDGLDLLTVDRESDLATYREANLWMRHR